MSTSNISFRNQYKSLGDEFYTLTRPSPVVAPNLIKFNHALAKELGLSKFGIDSAETAKIFSGNQLLSGTKPLAMAYAGHQFGHFNPQLGDGRAILLGEIVSPDGMHFDLQLKGSGQTAYSRNGDGRAALGPVLREYIVSEAMSKLGVPTTRALCMVTTGEQVARERLLPGGIITRTAAGFVRVGTFEYFSSRGNLKAIKKLADYVIQRIYPQANEFKNPYIELLKLVVDRQASLIALWMQFGFIHGVMNTDNMSVAGETIDYGPCAFMDSFNYDQVFSSIDRDGRYAYANQPSIALWNLTRLAESILPLLAEDTEAAVEVATSILKKYSKIYEHNWLSGMRKKIGLTQTTGDASRENDKALIDELLALMAVNHVDFTLMFFYLSRLPVKKTTESDIDIQNLFDDSVQFDNWALNWRKRLMDENQNDAQRQHNMQLLNPVYIPRNHQIEMAIRAAEDNDDFSVFHDLYEVLQNPFVLQEGKDAYMMPPKPEQVVKQTFCGT